MSPFFTWFGGQLVLDAFKFHRETGFGWGILHIVAFGPIQLAWALPLAIVCHFAGRRRIALGLLAGIGFLVLANLGAWAVGLAIGATG